MSLWAPVLVCLPPRFTAMSHHQPGWAPATAFTDGDCRNSLRYTVAVFATMQYKHAAHLSRCLAEASSRVLCLLLVHFCIDISLLARMHLWQTLVCCKEAILSSCACARSVAHFHQLRVCFRLSLLRPLVLKQHTPLQAHLHGTSVQSKPFQYSNRHHCSPRNCSCY